jgi:hypothetical protein
MSIVLAYSGLVVEDCEDAWTAGSNVTCSSEATIKKIGSASAKQITSGAGANELLCYENFSSANLSAYTYIAVWIYSSIALAAGDIQLKLDDSNGCGSALESINLPAIQASIWQRVILPIATPANCTAILSVGIFQVTNLADFTFYIDDVRAFNGKSFEPLHVIGITTDEGVDDRVIEGDGLDHSSYETYCSSRRNPFIDLGNVSTSAEKVFLRNFKGATDKSLFYGLDEVMVNVRSMEVVRYMNLRDVLEYKFTCIEKTAWTVPPSSWSL